MKERLLDTVTFVTTPKLRDKWNCLHEMVQVEARRICGKITLITRRGI